MKHKLILLFVFMVGIQDAYCGDSLYYEQRERLATSSIQALIKRGLCVDVNDCVIKQHILVSGSTGGPILNVYDVPDLSVISEILSAAINEYQTSGRTMGVSVEVFREKHEDVTGFIRPFFKSPYIKLYLRGEK